jgi:adenylate cyclase
VDEFHAENEGLLLVEIELKSEDQSFPRPDWLGEEVTSDYRYYNSWLAKNPFTRWK